MLIKSCLIWLKTKSFHVIQKINTYLKLLCMIKSTNNYNLYYFKQDGNKIILIIYIQNLFLIRKNNNIILWLK